MLLKIIYLLWNIAAIVASLTSLASSATEINLNKKMDESEVTVLSSQVHVGPSNLPFRFVDG